MYRPLLLLALALLSACQSPGLLHDFDPNRNFHSYRHWQWKEPAVLFVPDDPRVQNDLTAQRVIQAVEQQLQTHGLRMANDEHPADLLIQAIISIDTRQEILRSNQFDHWGHPLYGSVFSDVRSIEYPVRTLQLDLYDAADGRLIWRTALETAPEANNLSPAQRTAATQRSIEKMLQYFPPQ